MEGLEGRSEGEISAEFFFEEIAEGVDCLELSMWGLGQW